MALDLADSPSVIHLLRQRAVDWRGRVAMYHKVLGLWQPLSWDAYYTLICEAATACNFLGLTPGTGAAILSENRPEWLIADFAAIMCGLLSNGIYTTSSTEQIAYQIEKSGSEILFVEGGELLDKVLAMDARVLAKLKKIILFDMDGLQDLDHPLCVSWDEFLKLGRTALESEPDIPDQMIDELTIDKIAILIFTSGTTGAPKAAMISHRNILVQTNAWMSHYELSFRDRVICYLPLCHIAERQFSGMTPLATGAVVHFAESMEALGENMREVKPTVLFAPPRIYEKLSAQINLAIAEVRPLSAYAYQAARRRISNGATPLMRWVLKKTVLNNVLRVMGLSELRLGITGAAAASEELVDWYLSLGIPLYELFGMTETTGAVTHINRDGTHQFCGPPIEVGEVRIGSNNELQVRGPQVFCGYYGDREKTAEAITPDGWLNTGDQARIDEAGNIQIIGRIKDLLITSGGKNIAPSKIEGKIKASPYVVDAMLVGEGRKFITCLVMIDQETVSRFARDNGISFTDYKNLCRQTAVEELVRSEIAQVNSTVSRVEQVKDFKIIDVDLDAEDDELTPTLKLKRTQIEKKYSTQIEEMYSHA
ncbi:Long-chain-fatty-acid--CoA ligase FadD15 [Pseudovibrio axinellae]|uniref:Long-chain-fatty-acid--CoA ligase FadD15 n=1 Tax=Pseudovibrio axinellae TaxID=989403 RepID=A0A165ZG72_9HYPH|nr:long-chain fatty acid--CoA ligase [Pseudovibrio axinellae]KZL19864.1 Long-chain-fatty-acid--CoA ligase FadD15 [Pseudovibrio axinellae]SER38801.1 long-chain acyl-CoA synthetase [Pseudovibrio axinellae]